MMLKAASPFSMRSVACCQESPEASVLVQSRTLPKVSHALTIRASSMGILPFHRPVQTSGPSTPSATDSHRWLTVQFSPTESGAFTPLPFRAAQVERNSSQVLGGSTPHFLRFAGTNHITLERWMFTGTLQIPPLVESSVTRPGGNWLSQPSDLKSPVRSSIRPATTHVPISSWPACTWNESGGSPPSMRVLSTARALTPEPPVTVELTTWIDGFWAA